MTAAASLLAAAVLPLTAGAAAAAVAKCQAENITTGAKESPNLQALIDTAQPGQVIQVKGLCIGNYTIGKDLTIVGKPTKQVPAPTLRAALTDGIGRPVHVTAGVVTLQALTITGGSIDAYGGGILNAGNLTLVGSRVVGNHSLLKIEGPIAVGGAGGGIASSGPLTLTASTVSENTGDWIGGGVWTYGPSLVVHDSTISGNTTPRVGGGISISRTETLLSGSTAIDGNTAGMSGGGIQGTGYLTITDDSTVSNNSAVLAGGGVYTVLGWPLTLSGNATVVGNTSALDGGGLHVTQGSTLTMADAAMVSGNRADSDGNGTGTGGGLYTCNAGTLTGVAPSGNITLNYRGTDNSVIDDVTDC